MSLLVFRFLLLVLLAWRMVDFRGRGWLVHSWSLATQNVVSFFLAELVEPMRRFVRSRVVRFRSFEQTSRLFGVVSVEVGLAFRLGNLRPHLLRVGSAFVGETLAQVSPFESEEKSDESLFQFKQTTDKGH